MRKTAIISECGKYRYSLSRHWDDALPPVMFVMLNPSTADADNDDPTIRRCIGFGESWGYGGIIVTNLYAYRATDPKELIHCLNPVGNENEFHVSIIAEDVNKLGGIIVFAHGNAKIINRISTPIYKALENYTKHVIALSIDGTPKHPLYLNGYLKPRLML